MACRMGPSIQDFGAIHKVGGFPEAGGGDIAEFLIMEDHSFSHLPVEFPMKPDGHRPVSAPFRRRSDELPIETLPGKRKKAS